MIQGRMAIVVSLVLLLLGDGTAAWASDDKAGERTGGVLKASAIDSRSAPQDATDPQEITIDISSEHKAVISALLDAVEAETPITGIAEFDALSSTYGLMGIYRRSRKSSGFYGDRFRLTFPPAADVAAIAEAYWNLPYIKFVEPGPLPYARAWKASESLPTLGEFLRYVGNDRAVTRIPKKVGVGALTTASLGFVFLTMGETEGSDGFGVVAAASVALFFGYPVGVYLADMEESSFWMTCVGHGVGWWWAVLDAKKKRSGESEEWTSLVAIFGTPVIASELSRLVPKRFRNPNPLRWLFGIFRKPSAHVSFGLGPEPQRGLSAVVTLQF